MKISVTRRIDAPKNELWPYVADFKNIYRFHPLLKSSHALDDSQVSCEVGATRQCDMIDGNHIREKVIDYKEHSHYTVDIFETSMPITEAQATIGVKDIGNGQTLAYMNMEMTPKYGFLTPVMYPMFRYFAAPSILRGLEKIHKKEKTLQVVAA